MIDDRKFDSDLLRFIVLLLIKQPDKQFTGGYKLVKALTRWFHVLNYLQVFDHMITDGMIERELIEQIGVYSVTDKGSSWFEHNRTDMLIKCKSCYKTQEDKIDALISKL